MGRPGRPHSRAGRRPVRCLVGDGDEGDEICEARGMMFAIIPRSRASSTRSIASSASGFVVWDANQGVPRWLMRVRDVPARAVR